MSQSTSFMEELNKHDPEFFKFLQSLMEKTQEAGALDQKTRSLIMLAIDAAGSHPEGVKNLANRARVLGASNSEIIETIRLAFLGAGIPGLVAGLAAFQE